MARSVTLLGVLCFGCILFSGFSRFGGRVLTLLRPRHAAGFVGVPRSAAGLEAGPSGGHRESNHPDQQEHNAGYKKAPVARDELLHTVVEESQLSAWIFQHTILPSDLPQGKPFRCESLKIDATMLCSSLARAFARWLTLPLDAWGTREDAAEEPPPNGNGKFRNRFPASGLNFALNPSGGSYTLVALPARPGGRQGFQV